MSKSIYDETLGIMIDSILPRESNKTNKLKVIKALKQAQKQEKLLNKIKETIDRQDDDSYISSMLEESQKYYEIKELMIKEL